MSTPQLFPLDAALRGIRERFADAVIDSDRTSLRERTVVVPAARLAEVAHAVAHEWSGTFVSEWLALAGGFAGPRPAFAIIALAALTAGFLGIAFHWTRMVMGKPRDSFKDPMPRHSRTPLWALAVLLVTLGVWLPAPLRALVESAMTSVRP